MDGQNWTWLLLFLENLCTDKIHFLRPALQIDGSLLGILESDTFKNQDFEVFGPLFWRVIFDLMVGYSWWFFQDPLKILNSPWEWFLVVLEGFGGFWRFCRFPEIWFDCAWLIRGMIWHGLFKILRFGIDFWHSEISCVWLFTFKENDWIPILDRRPKSEPWKSPQKSKKWLSDIFKDLCLFTGISDPETFQNRGQNQFYEFLWNFWSKSDQIFSKLVSKNLEPVYGNLMIQNIFRSRSKNMVFR